MSVSLAERRIKNLDEILATTPRIAEYNTEDLGVKRSLNHLLVTNRVSRRDFQSKSKAVRDLDVPDSSSDNRTGAYEAYMKE